MNAECFPVSTLPHLSRLYADYLSLGQAIPGSPLRSWYGADPSSDAWMHWSPAPANPASPSQLPANQLPPTQPPPDRTPLASALLDQARSFGAGPEQLAAIERLRAGAPAVVTGQQVGLFGGPLLTLLKAATAVARARQASSQTGVDHVPIFWLATEDHDLAEVDQAALPGPQAIPQPQALPSPQVLPQSQALHHLSLHLAPRGVQVGAIPLGPTAEPLVDLLGDLLGHAPICDLVRRCYTSSATLGSAFARLLTALFAPHGLVVMDASTRAFHALGASTLAAAIERAPELEAALLARTAALEAAGYHAQVLVKPGQSLLFLVDEQTGQRQPLRRLPDHTWKAGAHTFSTPGLLALLAAAPERLSPNALLRPLFQDTILPTAAYLGGPAEIAYFAQSQVLYERLLPRTTPILPRFSATLVSPAAHRILARHQLSLPDVWEAAAPGALAQRLGARALPEEGRRKLSAAGDALDTELDALTGYLGALDPGLGRSAQVSASKMRYQMNRLRRLAARFELERDASLTAQADLLLLNLYPEGHLQERVLAGVFFLAQVGDPQDLIARLVEAARDRCPGHTRLAL